MYKIYINENELLLKSNKQVANQNYPAGALVAPYAGKRKMLLNYIDMMEKSNNFKKVVLHYLDKKVLRDDFQSLYTVIQAAGGLVENPGGEYLMIHRRGYWDLPKGKIDPGEKKRDAAIREVEEETGINEIVITDRISKTYHTYKLKSGKRAIKKTYWYHMMAPDQTLTPQIEEDITEARWMKIGKIQKLKDQTYKNIYSVFESKNLV